MGIDYRELPRCPGCRSCTNCTGFQKVVEVKDTGLVVYRQSSAEDELHRSSTKSNNDVFIIENKHDRKITAAEYKLAFETTYKIHCPRCRSIVKHAEKFLQNIPAIKQQDVLGVCNHCMSKRLRSPCCECKKAVQMFIDSKNRKEESNKNFNNLLTKLDLTEKVPINQRIEGTFYDDNLNEDKKITDSIIKILNSKKENEDAIAVSDLFTDKLQKSLPGISRELQVNGLNDELQKPKVMSSFDDREKKTPKFPHHQADLQSFDGQEKPIAAKIGGILRTKINLGQPKLTINVPQSSTAYITDDYDEITGLIKPESLKTSDKKEIITSGIRKYHSQESIFTTISELNEKVAIYKGFDYFFPRLSLKDVKHHVSSSELIKGTRDMIKEREEEKVRIKEAKLKEKEAKFKEFISSEFRKIEKEKIRLGYTASHEYETDKVTDHDGGDKSDRDDETRFHNKYGPGSKKRRGQKRHDEDQDSETRGSKTRRSHESEHDWDSKTVHSSKIKLSDKSERADDGLDFKTASVRKSKRTDDIGDDIKTSRGRKTTIRRSDKTKQDEKFPSAFKTGDNKKNRQGDKNIQRDNESEYDFKTSRGNKTKITDKSERDDETRGHKSGRADKSKKTDHDKFGPHDKSGKQKYGKESDNDKDRTDLAKKDNNKAMDKKQIKGKDADDAAFTKEIGKQLKDREIDKEEEMRKLIGRQKDEKERLKTEELKKQEMQKNQMEVNLDKIKVKDSNDDSILKLMKVKQDTVKRSHKDIMKTNSALLRDHKHHKTVDINCGLCMNSDLCLDVENLKRGVYENTDIIIGERILKHKRPMVDNELEKDLGPIFYKSTFNEDDLPVKSTATSELRPIEVEQYVKKGGTKTVDPEATKGVIRYALSDRSFIDKGWTMLPTEKVVRKMNVYRMRPAKPEFDWFNHNKYKKEMFYDTGENLAMFSDTGRCMLYYRNRQLALDYYEAEETNALQRFVVYSSGEPDDRGRTHPVTILATFDYLGNGIVFDHSGKIRLKYNQTEGVILDRSLGPVSHWKWHTLNDPPVLQQVMIDTQMSYKDPDILKLGGSQDDKTRPDNEEMLAIEFDNFIKEKSKKLSQKFKPFQIKMKALKINEYFSLKVLDQANVYLIYRDGTTNIKLNIGMVLDHQEIVDTDTAEVGEVSNSLERLPAKTASLETLQAKVATAQRLARLRGEREGRLRPSVPAASIDKLTAPASKPLHTQALPSVCRSRPYCCRKPSMNVYCENRLI